MAEPNPAELSDPITKTKIEIEPKFTKILLVDDDGSPNRYSTFVTAVREAVKDYCKPCKGIDRPVLPPEKKIPEFWFYVELRTKPSSITLAIRMDNLYLVGFRTPAGVWWEFGKDGDTHLLNNNPRWLGFGGRYQDLIPGGEGLETIKLGPTEMAAAVNDLGKKTMTLEEEEELLLLQQGGADEAAAADPQGDTRGSLVKLVIMVCEGLRFSTVSDKVDEGFKNHQSVNINQLDGKRVNKWDRISKAIFTWAVNPTEVIPDMQNLVIKDKNEAARIVALVKNQTTVATASATDENSEV